jgi:hypothetical protein
LLTSPAPLCRDWSRISAVSATIYQHFFSHNKSTVTKQTVSHTKPATVVFPLHPLSLVYLSYHSFPLEGKQGGVEGLDLV